MASSLNSSYFYILHNGNTVYIWIGSFATTEDQELAERLLDVIKVFRVFYKNIKILFCYSYIDHCDILHDF